MSNGLSPTKQANSQTVTSAAIGLLAFLATLIVVALQSRTPGAAYWVITVAAFGLLALSIILGGLGVAHPQKSGYFNRQALTCALGGVLVISSVFLMGPRPEDRLEASVKEITKKIGELETQLRTGTTALEARIGNDVKALREDVRRLETELKKQDRKLVK